MKLQSLSGLVILGNLAQCVPFLEGRVSHLVFSLWIDLCSLTVQRTLVPPTILIYHLEVCTATMVYTGALRLTMRTGVPRCPLSMAILAKRQARTFDYQPP